MKKVIFSLLLLMFFLLVRPELPVAAQISGPEWSEPVRLSSNDPIGEPARMISDPYGFLHVMWTEIHPDSTTSIFYSRFDGKTWTVPIDVYITPENFSINSLHPVVDEYGILHVYWAQGVMVKRMFSMQVSVYDTLSANKWEGPTIHQITAEEVALRIDSEGTLHILFSRIDPAARGVYYMYSHDRGETWSNPVWIDSDIPPGLYPRGLNFLLDDQDGLHALWHYAIFDEKALGDTTNWIYYAHLLKGEENWTSFTIDKADSSNADSGYQLNAAGPVLIVSGQTVHVIWAGGTLHYRHHRYSTDAGRTWTKSTRIFGDLNGQAFDGSVLENQGRIHYFTQIRFPLGIYYATWKNGHWTSPAMVYFVRFSDTDPPSDQVEAHATFPAILGDTLILTFTDPPPYPTRGLYMTSMKLTDSVPVAPITPLPALPTSTPERIATPEPTATPNPTATPRVIPAEQAPPANSISGLPGQTFVIGTILSLFLIGVVFIIRLMRR